MLYRTVLMRSRSLFSYRPEVLAGLVFPGFVALLVSGTAFSVCTYNNTTEIMTCLISRPHCIQRKTRPERRADPVGWVRLTEEATGDYPGLANSTVMQHQSECDEVES